MIIIRSAKYLSFIAAVTLLFLGSVFSAEASSVIRTGEVVSVAEEQTVEGDFYAVAGKINLSGSVQEDMFAVGGQVTVNGGVGSDTFLVGGQVDVHGTIADDLRVVAGEVTIAEPVMGDVFVIAGVVNILSTASVAGDVVVFGGDVTISGSVGGDVLGTMESLRVDSQVAGNVDVTVNQLTLGDRTKIDGSVFYVSKNVVIQALNATVSGEQIRNDPVLPVAEASATSVIIPILVLLFSALVWYWVSRHSLQRMTERALILSPRPILIGSATAIFTPVAVGLLLASFIGSLVGLILLFGYLLFITLSFVGLTAVIGQLLLHTFNKNASPVSLTSLVIGVIGVALLVMLPVVGGILLTGFTALTLGAMVDLLIRPKVE